eukprot:m.161260 g.161260  ORF g.161260 m.161260 type:complete len:64 (-) comp16373_c7_seq6:429-620(-)
MGRFLLAGLVLLLSNFNLVCCFGTEIILAWNVVLLRPLPSLSQSFPLLKTFFFSYLDVLSRRK